MTRNTRGWLALLTVILGMSLPVEVRAGPLWDACFGCKDCPPTQYPFWHVWAPTYWRVEACCHPPHVPIYPGDRYPDVGRPMEMRFFPCPAAPPVSMSYDLSAKAK